MKEKISTNKEILVSICVVTYNHEKYIIQCLESLINQDVDFEYEILVGDDCSQDSTTELIKNLTKKSIKPIQHIVRNSNLGAIFNAVDLYKRARGRYIAHIDGDDLAAPNKLQLQVTALKENPHCSICTHDMFLIKNQKYLKRTFKKIKTGEYDIIYLLNTLPFFAHSSKMFRNDSSDDFWNNVSPEAFDFESHVFHAKKGSIYHIDQPLGSYRLNTSSVTFDKLHFARIAAIERVFNDAISTYPTKSTEIKKYYAKCLMEISTQCATHGSHNEAINLIKRSIQTRYFSIQQIVVYILLRLNLLKFILAIRYKLSYK